MQPLMCPLLHKTPQIALHVKLHIRIMIRLLAHVNLAFMMQDTLLAINTHINALLVSLAHKIPNLVQDATFVQPLHVLCNTGYYDPGSAYCEGCDAKCYTCTGSSSNCLICAGNRNDDPSLLVLVHQ